VSTQRAIPVWLVQAISGTIVGAILAWGAWATTTAAKHEARIAVVETKINEVHENIQDIKATELRINAKLDRLIEGPHGSRAR